jgi:heat shock protein HtpX
MYSQIDSNRRKTWILVFLFVGILAAAGWFVGYVYSDSGPSALAIALAISLGMTLVSWYAGDKIALSMHGAEEITERDQFPTLWNLVENLAITAGIPRPRIYIINDPALNAFATGRNPARASVAVTTGLLNHLEKPELEGVIAHELSHIKNLDIRVMMVVIVLVGAITILGDSFFRMSRVGGRGNGNKNQGSGIIMLIGIVFLVVAPLAGELIKLAVSRKREYLADASGALLTRYPDGLASALEKIRDAGIPLQRTSRATNHLWIAEPKMSVLGAKMGAMLSTHPPIGDRIAKLRGMGDNSL